MCGLPCAMCKINGLIQRVRLINCVPLSTVAFNFIQLFSTILNFLQQFEAIIMSYVTAYLDRSIDAN